MFRRERVVALWQSRLGGVALAIQVLWAKSGGAGSSAWHPLLGHLLDALHTAEALWDGWLSVHVRTEIAAALPDGAADGRRLFAWLAGLHDLGKASPAFQVQAVLAAERVRLVLDLPEVIADRRRCPHATAGGVGVVEQLLTRGWSKRQTRWVASIVQGHHGVFSSEGWREEAISRPHLLGGADWAGVRRELFEVVSDRAGVRDRLPAWSNVQLPEAAQLLLAGLVVFADWCASTETCFPYAAPLPAGYAERSRRQAARVPALLGWGAPWRPAPGEPTGLLQRRFGFAARTVQQATTRAAAAVAGPALLLVEAPMGEGKTEAALAATELLAAANGCNGVFIGLPTQATSNGMFPRVVQWLQAQGSAATVALAHGGAGRHEPFQALLDRPTAVLDEGADGQVAASQWFTGRKRALLAPVVIGTVDQLLLAAVKARHVSLRHAGLGGKVVLVDEVHAYDAYMSVFLDRALQWLAALGVPVILLSATLPPPVRHRLIAAYQAGLGHGGAPTAAELRQGHAEDGRPAAGQETGYPQLTVVAAAGVTTTEVAAGDRAAEVQLRVLDEPVDDGSAVAGWVTGRLGSAGCVLVVRNTVSRAQQTYLALRRLLPDTEVSLLHARFTADDRAGLEYRLLDRFGPRGHRPGRHVVVATQVVEQSLDVDFDLLVSDLAPVDLLLQRVGRLHRHDRIRPPGLVQPTVLVVGVQHPPAGMPLLPRGSVAVYGEHLLARSAAVLHGRQQIALPADVPSLVAAVYGEQPVGPAQWQPPLAAARAAWEAAQEDRRAEADRYVLRAPSRTRTCLDGLHDGGGAEASDDDPTLRAHVRDGDPAVTVVLLDTTPDGVSGRLPDGTEVALAGSPIADTVARRVLGRAVRLPSRRAVTAAALTHCATPPAWRRSGWLSGQLLLPIAAGRAQLGPFTATYDADLGLEVSY
jgi:CRISPR-associated endonuclease/helicase Cas3